MFSRRLATFLLGVWIGCCVLVDIVALEGQRTASKVLDNPNPDVKDVLTKSGNAPVGTLLHHTASEQVRGTLRTWGAAQLVIALIMLVLLIFTDQRKILAIAMSAAMGILVLIQHFGVTPDLNMLGRSVDFLPEATSFSARTQIWTLTQIYGALETLKLIIGGILASYFFGMESTVKRSKTRRTRTADAILDAPVK
ncbi:MAG: hypothetical protein ABIR70_16630 [Bryobacteraceae bacterium]